MLTLRSLEVICGAFAEYTGLKVLLWCLYTSEPRYVLYSSKSLKSS